jgi:hypothetical protein
MRSQLEIIDAPELVQGITAAVEPEEYDPADLRFAPSIGFVALQQEGCTYALGFCAMPDGYTGEPPLVMRSVTDLSEVPGPQRNIDRQGKGVGARLHNTLPAISGMAEPTPTALYAVQIDPEVEIKDIRGKHDHDVLGMAGRIARHAGRIVRSKVQSLDTVVDCIHESYGRADLVLLNQPPNARRRQIMRGVQSMPGVDQTLFIVRDESLLLRRAGRIRGEAQAT